MNTRTSSFLPTAVLTALAAAAILAPPIFSPATAEACSIPVFRYALQFWQPDTFDALIFHRGELAKADEQTVRKLTAAVNESIGANVNVQRVDLADEDLPEQLGQLWQTIQVPGQESLKRPHMLTLDPRSYGHNGAPVPAESISLAELRLDRWMISPARKTITERLAKGESAVWVVLGIGDEKKDAAAMKTLSTTLEKLETTLELPEQVPEPDLMFEPDVEVGAELRVAFSTLAESRDDDAEKHFVSHLLSSESDLRDFEEPMVFAVFGRGRALPALVGQGINEELIGEVAGFLVGPCSCQVKAQNPGFDLLLTADWETLLQKANAALSEDTLAVSTGITTGITTGISTEISTGITTGVALTGTAPDGSPTALVNAVSGSTAESTTTLINRPAAAPPPAAGTPRTMLDGRMVLGLVVVGLLGLAALVIGTAIILKKNAAVGYALGTR